MNKNELTEYADYLLKTAMFKVNNIEDAEDLVQETLLAALAAVERNKPIEDVKNWLVTVLHRKYYDMLRRRYRKGTVSIDVIGECPVCDEISEQIEQSEEAENIRRCLAYLTQLYRQVMVRYYMHGESVKQIAAALNIPENTVKSRLDTGRKHIRKDLTMENYTKQSYEPETLWISISGRSGINDEPFSLVGNSRIEMNLLILAYAKPVTIPELAGAIGISTAYIEPIVDKLVNGELMKRAGDKVYTDFIIFNEHDRTANIELEKELADKHYRSVWEIVERGLEELHDTEYYKRQTPSAAAKLDSFFVVRTVLNGINSVIENKVGNWSFEEFTDRPNGGKWHAMGSCYPADYDWEGTYWYKKYYISGEYDVSLDNYEGHKAVSLPSYDTMLGKAYHGWSDIRYVKRPMDTATLAKMLYAVYAGKEDMLPVIDAHCFDNIDGLIKLGILTRDDSGKVMLDIPVIKMNDRWELYKLSDKYSNEITQKLGREFEVLLKNPVKLPPHLRSVPDWQRYAQCSALVNMMLIMNAHDNGLFLADRDLEKEPVPAVFLAIAE